MQPSRRQFLIAGVAVAATGAAVIGTSGSVSADTYGSGQLGSWEGRDTYISSDQQIRRVLAGNGVFMFGDSLGVQDCSDLSHRFTRLTGQAMAVHNWSGQPAEPIIDAMQLWAQRYGLPDRILISAGSNDIFTPPALTAQIDRAMRIAGPTRTVFWVNVYVKRRKKDDLVQRADLRNSAWVNRQLDDAEKRYPNLHIVRWEEFLAKMNYSRRYVRDGVHTRAPLGRQARNGLIIKAIRDHSAKPAGSSN